VRRQSRDVGVDPIDGAGRERSVIVVLQDGQQLDDWMRPFERTLECDHVLFLAYELVEMFPE
jgi:hypothetical protein